MRTGADDLSRVTKKRGSGGCEWRNLERCIDGNCHDIDGKGVGWEVVEGGERSVSWRCARWKEREGASGGAGGRRKNILFPGATRENAELRQAQTEN